MLAAYGNAMLRNVEDYIMKRIRLCQKWRFRGLKATILNTELREHQNNLFSYYLKY